MTNDISQTNLREPNQTDWDNYNSGSKYIAPPPALGADGRPITYYGIAEKAEEKANQYAVDSEGNAYLNFQLDPVKIVRSGGHDGYVLRFTEASVKPFEKGGAPIKGNPNKLANFLRAAGLQARPQTNNEYRASVRAAIGKPFGFTIDWVAKNKETGEEVKGYSNFPDDPERPGMKKSILKAGDVVTERDAKGNVTGTRTITSEVLFANARLRFFQDAAPKVAR